MSAAARIEPTDMALTAQVERDPLIILQAPEKLPAFLSEMRNEIAAHVPDLTTDKGRKAIASLAYKITRTKTAIDAAGKKLNEDARAQISAVDKVRKDVRDRLDALADEVRRPLTEWEEAEKARSERANAIMDELRATTTIPAHATVDMVRDRIGEVEREEITAELFAESLPIARALRDQALEALRAGLVRLEQAAAERAELERLRAAEAARLQKEAEERAAREAEEAAKRAEAERIEREERAAEEAVRKVQAAAEAKARAEQDARDRAHAEEVAALKRQAEQAEAARLAEQRRRDDEAKAAEKRAANERHVSKVMTAAKEALMRHGEIDEDAAKRIVLAIKANSIPAVTINF